MTPGILIVEDNKDNMKLMRYLLESRGHEPRSADTGPDGVRMALEDEPELVLMDIQMPRMDGFEAASRIWEGSGDNGSKIVAVTAFAMDEDKQKILGAGFDGYITKPIVAEDFVDEVERFLLEGSNESEGCEA